MTLQDIFDQLSTGELSQIAIGGGEAGRVSGKGFTSLARSVQLGLTALYKRFNLKEERSTANLLVNQLEYPMAMDDLMKVERVLTAAGLDLPLNDSSSPDSCFTPSNRVLRLPAHIAAQANDLDDHLKTTTLTLVYRANHPPLDMEVATSSPEEVEIELPDAYLQALLFFVASRVHAPQGMDGNFNPGNNFFARYEAECKSLENEGLQVDKGGSENRLSRGGWV